MIVKETLKVGEEVCFMHNVEIQKCASAKYRKRLKRRKKLAVIFFKRILKKKKNRKM